MAAAAADLFNEKRMKAMDYGSMTREEGGTDLLQGRVQEESLFKGRFLVIGSLLCVTTLAVMVGSGSVTPVSMRGASILELWGSSHHHPHHTHSNEHEHEHSNEHEHEHEHTTYRDTMVSSFHNPDLHTTQAVAGLQLPGYPSPEVQLAYEKAVYKLDWEAVKIDVRAALTNSQDWWPADYGNYGGLFVRLSWHSCGSYRTSDGRGGCDGGGQRFDPERSWPDNTNLDKARRLLQPIKEKYGIGLSWGDLFALSGTLAIEQMGGPVLGFCGGRIDVVDNSQTLALGPTPEQEKFAECPVDGDCPYPLGQNTLGLIYVNPEGPFGEPDPVGAAGTIRDVFGRMDWQGRNLVALIGGGHTFGKAHGASTASNGDPPNKCPFASWLGPTGKDAITSGFEGPWTSHPTKWDNDYFKYLMDYEWEAQVGPGGHHQWKVVGDNGPKAPSPDPNSDEQQDVMMLTTDVALKIDPEYNMYVKEFAENQTALDEEFAYAWYKLVTRDMGPVQRCVGPDVPKAQKFQHPLPPPPKHLANMDHVAKDLRKLLESNPDCEFVRLAHQCASTFRATDYQGGCNGARIRFPPGSEWPVNEGLNETLALLEPIKESYGDGLSWADLIVLAGNVAAEDMGSPPLKFCSGRTDDTSGHAWERVEYGNKEWPATVEEMIEMYQRRGQTAKDVVALAFVWLGGSAEELKAVLESDEKGDVYREAIRYYPEFRYWAEHFAAAGDEVWGEQFAFAWTKFMNADRFDGPVRNACSLI